MELKISDYYKNEGKSLIVFTVLVAVLLLLVRFIVWVPIGSEGTFGELAWIWFTRILTFGAIVVSTLGFYFVILGPCRHYLEDRRQVQTAARMTHWEGGLAKSMRDFGKALKEGNQVAVEKTAQILLKEIQIHCAAFNRATLPSIEAKLEGICEGYLGESLSVIAQKIDLQIVLNSENYQESLCLRVGDITFKRSLRCAS